MKIAKRSECCKCENLKFDESWDSYVCFIEPKDINQYIGETKWQLEYDSTIRRCLKQ